MELFVDDAPIDHRQMLMLDLDVINKHRFCKDSVPPHSGNSFLPGDSRNHSGGI